MQTVTTIITSAKQGAAAADQLGWRDFGHIPGDVFGVIA